MAFQLFSSGGIPSLTISHRNKSCSIENLNFMFYLFKIVKFLFKRIDRVDTGVNWLRALGPACSCLNQFEVPLVPHRPHFPFVANDIIFGRANCPRWVKDSRMSQFCLGVEKCPAHDGVTGRPEHISRNCRCAILVDQSVHNISV